MRVCDLLERAAPLSSATHVLVHAHGGYTTNLRWTRSWATTCSSPHTFDGRPLERDHGGPARLLVPAEVSVEVGEVGERAGTPRPVTSRACGKCNGYHNDGDPWAEERHTADQWSVRQVRRRLRGADPASIDGVRPAMSAAR